MHVLSPWGKGNSHLTKLLSGPNYERIWRYKKNVSNSPPCATARWPPQQIPPFKFPGSELNSTVGRIDKCQHACTILTMKLHWFTTGHLSLLYICLLTQAAQSNFMQSMQCICAQNVQMYRWTIFSRASYEGGKMTSHWALRFQVSCWLSTCYFNIISGTL